MKNSSIIKTVTSVMILFLAFNFVNGNPPAKSTEKKPILQNKKVNPNYDPNKGILGKPKEERVIKRNRDEPILKNRKYEPKRLQKNK